MDWTGGNLQPSLSTQQKHREKIKKFVKTGGTVIVAGQDSEDDHLCETGWLEEKLKGIKHPPAQNFKIIRQGDKLFSEPNLIQSGQLLTNNAWTNWDKHYEILATTNDGKDLVVGTREHGKGLYIITSLHNNDQGTVGINKRLMENILNYAVNRSR